MRPPIGFLNYYYRTLDKQKQQHIVMDGQCWSSADQLQTKVWGEKREREFKMANIITII